MRAQFRALARNTRTNPMDFHSVRLITDDPKRLVGFYEAVTGLSATWYSEDFAEVATRSGVLAIASARVTARVNPGAARPADNHSAILEFRVGDVDAEYEKHKHAIGEVVQPPTTMPWGNRSLLFRDPDGNLVNLFAPVTAEAIRRFETARA